MELIFKPRNTEHIKHSLFTKCDNSAIKLFMKRIIALLGVLVFTSVTFMSGARADEATGFCSLKGVKKSAHLSFFPWQKEKEFFENITLDQCVENSTALLGKTWKAKYHRCTGPRHNDCEERTTSVRIKRVDYQFSTDDNVTTGSVE